MGRAASFWAWFYANEHLYRDVQVPENEELLDALLEQLHRFSKDLWFEVGGHPSGPRELVISAEGNVDAFPSVKELVSSAPMIPGWTFIAFKPAQGFDFVTEYNGITVSPAASWFLPLYTKKNPHHLGLRVAYSHYDEAKHDTFRTATYLMLEAGLGELAAAEEIQHLEVCVAPSIPRDDGYRLLIELPQFLGDRGG